MQLSGRLQLTTLGDLLGTVLREGLTGTLELTEEKGPSAGRVHRLYLDHGHVVQVETQRTISPLGELLASAGWLKPSEVADAVARARASGMALGRWLVSSGRVPEPAMVEAIVQQLRLRLDALFRVEDARVAFRVVQTRRRELDAPRFVSPGEYLSGRPRARDRSTKSAPTPSTRTQATRTQATRTQTAGTQTTRSQVTSLSRRDLLLLGLGADAGETEIRMAFRRFARAYHPDMHPTAGAAEREIWRRRFAEVSGAYHRLLSQLGLSKLAV